MAITVTNIPGYQFTQTEEWTPDKLNLLGQPTFTLAGTLTSTDIAAGAVTSAKSTPGPYWYGTGVLTSNTYALTLSPALAALTAGSEVWFRANADYLDAAATGICLLDVNGLGAIALKKNKSHNLDKHDIVSGQVVGCRHDGTFWQMISHLGHAMAEFVGTDTGVVNAIALAPEPAFTAYDQIIGRVFYFRPAFDNTGPPTLQISGIAAPPTIKKNNNEDLIAGDLALGQVVGVIFDGTNFQLITPVADVAVGNINGLSRGLRVSITNMTTINAFADEIFLRETTGRYIRVEGLNVNSDITVTGANGRDGFVEAGGTWYYLWIIHNGTAPAALLSQTNVFGTLTSTMPAGYNARALVGAVYNNTSSDFESLNEYGAYKKFISGQFDLPATRGVVADVSHNLGGRPREVRWVLRCGTTDLEYVPGDELDFSFFQGAGNRPSPLGGANVTNVFATLEDANIRGVPRTTGTPYGVITKVNWKAVCYATL